MQSEEISPKPLGDTRRLFDLVMNMGTTKRAIEEWRARRNKRIAERTRLDFEVGDYPPDEPGDKGTSSHGNTRLPYGLCKSAGIDTTGMTPADAWAALAGKTGITAEKAYKELKEHGSAKGIKPSSFPDDGDIAGTEELEGGGPIPEPYKKAEKPSKPEKSKDVLKALEKLDSQKGTKSEEQIQTCLEKLKEHYGEGGKIGFVTVGGRAHLFDLSHPLTASNLAYFKHGSAIYTFAGSNEDEANEELKSLISEWKSGSSPEKISTAYSYELLELRKAKNTGKISSETYESEVAKAKAERKSQVLKALPTINDCKSVDDVRIRMDAVGDFKNSAQFSKSADVDNAKEAAASAERMFSIFPTMKGRVDSINATVPKSKSYAWVQNKKDSGIFISKTYFANRKKLQAQYESDVAAGFHPEGTNTRAIVDHEFTHVIDMNLSKYVSGKGGIPGHPGAMISTVIAREMALERKMTLYELKSRVCKYATKKYSKMDSADEMEFLAECIAEYLESPSPREIAVDCANRLFGYMRKFWGDKAVDESKIK